jgi:anti-sigma factor RsiW
MNSQHQTEALGAYVLGALDQREADEVTDHLASCPECQAQADELTGLRDALGEVPPEAFLDGPPEDGDLVLQRTLRRLRAAKAGARRTRVALGSAAAVLALVAALGGGVLLGRQGTTSVGALPPPAASATPTPVPGTRVIFGTQGGARLNVTVTPAAGWVRVNASATGIAAGERCQLVVVARSGDTEVAGSWLVSPQGAINGTNLDGSALIPVDQVASVQVRDFAGQTLVTASM